LLEIRETLVVGKRADDALCEDGLVSTAQHVAVIDGATTEQGHEIAGRSPGRFAMEAVAEAIRGLAPDVDAVSAIGELSQALADALAREGVQPGELASACVVIASAQRREVWRVGNSTFAIDGTVHPQQWNLVDIPARMRSAYLKALLRAGAATAETLAEKDPGAELIAPLLRTERVFRNAPDAGDLAYSAIDGCDVPDVFIEQVALPTGAEVVFASDGYPFAAPTLAEAEAYLEASLAEDPLRIHEHPEVRGVSKGNVSYDDRAYVRFRVT
jgi:glycerophosphoryl diester phosphodiesterase